MGIKWDRIRHKVPFVFVTFLLLLGGSASAHGDDAARNEDVMRLSLQDCIRLALNNNLDIKIEEFNPQILDTDIARELAKFDPVWTIDITDERSEIPTATSFLAGADISIVEQINMNTGIEQKLITGGNYELKFYNNRYESNAFFQSPNPAYGTNLLWEWTQPLLKDFGKTVNESGIVIARNNKEISEEMFKSQVIRTVLEVEKVYWDMVYAIEDLKVKELSLKEAKDLLEINKAKVGVGLLPPIEVLEAETGVANRSLDIISAKDSVRDASDKLKSMTHMIDDMTLWDMEVEPADRPVVEMERQDIVNCIATAFENRPDYLMSKKDILNKDIRLKVTKNHLLPTLDLVGSFGVNGLDREYESSLNDIDSADFPSWSIGLSVQVPWGNQSARSDYMQSKLEKMQILVKFKKLEQDIVMEAREAIRQIETDLNRIESNKIALQLEESKLETEKKRFEEGLATSHNLLEFQNDVAEARSNSLKATIDYNKSIANLENVKGTLFKKWDIKFE
jgi:outer membrane protein TolC